MKIKTLRCKFFRKEKKRSNQLDLISRRSIYSIRSYISSFSRDEELLCQGLALNYDLQRVLPKHESIASGSAGLEKSRTSVTVEKPKTLQSLVDIDDAVGTKDDTTHHDGSSGASTSQHVPLLVLVPPSNGSVTPPSVKVDPKMDLLSGEDFDNSLALVPVDAPHSTTPPTSGAGQTYPPTSQFQPQQQQTFYTNASPQRSSEAFPQPPWEVQETNNIVTNPHQPPMQMTQVVVTHTQPSLNVPCGHPMGNRQVMGMYVQPITSGHLQNHPIQSNMGMPNQQKMHGGQMMGGMVPPQTMYVGGGKMMGGMVPPQIMHGYGGGNFSSVNNLQQRGQHMTQLYEQQKGDDVWWKEEGGTCISKRWKEGGTSSTKE
ncbi:hypothetical protein MKX03_028716 [Papaver bracteatum]|nr:hypothetical protein MKX03_028716 [Papaver bracteatum]